MSKDKSNINTSFNYEKNVNRQVVKRDISEPIFDIADEIAQQMSDPAKFINFHKIFGPSNTSVNEDFSGPYSEDFKPPWIVDVTGSWGTNILLENESGRSTIGSKSLKLTGNQQVVATYGPINCEGDRPYTFWMKWGADSTDASATFAIDIEWLDQDDAIVSTETLLASTTATSVTGVSETAELKPTSPSGAVKYQIKMIKSNFNFSVWVNFVRVRRAPYSWFLMLESNQTSVDPNTWTQVAMDAKKWDHGNQAVAGGNGRFTAVEPGYYFVAARLRFILGPTETRAIGAIRKNDDSAENYYIGEMHVQGTDNVIDDSTVCGNTIIELDEGDYVELFGWTDEGSSFDGTFRGVHTAFWGFGPLNFAL